MVGVGRPPSPLQPPLQQARHLSHPREGREGPDVELQRRPMTTACFKSRRQAAGDNAQRLAARLISLLWVYGQALCNCGSQENVAGRFT